MHAVRFLNFVCAARMPEITRNIRNYLHSAQYARTSMWPLGKSSVHGLNALQAARKCAKAHVVHNETRGARKPLDKKTQMENAPPLNKPVGADRRSELYLESAFTRFVRRDTLRAAARL